jgi:hypothetical protein
MTTDKKPAPQVKVGVDDYNKLLKAAVSNEDCPIDGLEEDFAKIQEDLAESPLSQAPCPLADWPDDAYDDLIERSNIIVRNKDKK